MKGEQMTSRERVRAAISRAVPDRVPIFDEIWSATVKRWQNEGLPQGTSPDEYFGYDFVKIIPDLSPRFSTEVLEENEKFIIETTPYGEVLKNRKDFASTPEIMECFIKKKDDWLTIKERLKPDYNRVDWTNARKIYRLAKEQGKYVILRVLSGYEVVGKYIKSDQLLMFMAQDPEWIKEIVEVGSGLILETLKMMHAEGLIVDGLWTFNDMGYKNSSLFSPAMYIQIIGPSDKKRNDWCHENGIQTILHSCGCVKGLMPMIIKHGFDCLQPLEIKAGMDLKEMKAVYGDKIALFGGINVMTMEDPDDSKIENEIKEKFKIAMQGGGYLYHSDHSIPPDISFRKYQFIVDCVRRYGLYK